MIKRVFGKHFNSEGGALTLNAAEVTEGSEDSGVHTRVHPDGWTITGEIHEDYYTWVNEFKAKHPKFGRVWGNFETEVFADNKKGFDDFYKGHIPQAWDYQDI